LSPPRLGRGASSASSRPAARTSGRPGVFVQTPKSDIYVTMLGIALGAILLGCLLLFLLLNRYEFQLKAAAIDTNPRPALVSASDRVPTLDRLLLPA
jgi:hypothetical protein